MNRSERHHIWYVQNRETVSLKNKEYYQQNKERLRNKRMHKDPLVRKAYAHANYLKRRDTGYFRKLRAEYRKREREKHHAYFEMIIAHYGGKCTCCGESNHKFLTVEHLNGGGCKHNRQISNKVYRWLVLNDFPDGFTILCYNCNLGKSRNHGICPHKEVSMPYICRP